MKLKEKEDSFTESIENEDHLLIVVKGHLHLENELISLLETVFLQKDCLDASDLRFPLKVKLVAALGLLPKDSLPVFLKFNSLRNKFAHNLEMEITAKEVEVLIGALSKRQSYIFWGENKENRKKESYTEQLRYLISILFVELTQAIEKINASGYIITNNKMGKRLKSILINYILKMNENMDRYKLIIGGEIEDTEDIKIIKNMKKELEKNNMLES